MRVRVLLFGVLQEIFRTKAEEQELRAGATLNELLAQYRSRASQAQAALMDSIAVAVNQEYARPEQALNDGDEVALLPPVSGGAPEAVPQALEPMVCEIVRQPIDTAGLLARMKQGEDGAAVVFEGIVRNNTRGRRSLYLEYEAYDAMALEQMRAVGEKALANYAIRQIALVHRLGRLEIGETSVVIIVSSAHRAAAFDACRYAIDTLKRTVPIWKKEFFDDGAVWAPGEPFPDELSSGKQAER